MALGLSLIFGLMGLVNLAHGSFFLLGAYLALTIARLTHGFWFALLLAPLAVGLVGIALERTWLSRFSRRSEMDQVILTFGFSLVFQDIAKFFWGVEILSLKVPSLLEGSIRIAETQFPVYRLFIIVMGGMLFLITWLIIERTRLGALIRAAVSDRDMVAGLGFNVKAIFAVMFAVGLMLAGCGGVLAAPITSVYLGLDFQIMITTLIVVVVGGLGSIRGAFLASLLIGISETYGKALIPSFATFLIFTLMAVVLVIRSIGHSENEESV
jgi:branched-subunit amino acid ABC-type transport system permease component